MSNSDKDSSSFLLQVLLSTSSKTFVLFTTPIPLPTIMSSSTQSTSSASVTSNSSTRRECLHAHWVACHDAHPSEHRSLMSPSSQSPTPSQFTPLSAITLHLPLQFSHPPTMANGVTPLLFSAAGGLADGPLPLHPAGQAGMTVGADVASRVCLLEEWMDRLERQANQPPSEQNAMDVTFLDYLYASHTQTYSDCSFFSQSRSLHKVLTLFLVPLHCYLRYHCTIRSDSSTTFPCTITS